ncbi:hypothetical protein BJF79_02395 [Actinomadura sp. CNU-125]|nr:hypothetical protein BJF79_02395 [Actinomadura sp. CNU-125]
MRNTGSRFADLIAATDPRAMATADWTVADTAAHVLSIGTMNVWLTRRDGTPSPISAVTDRLGETNVDRVADLNVVALAENPERDTEVLAERLRSDIDEVLRATEDMDPATPVSWLGGARVPLAGLLAHHANEMAVHGLDIARAVNTPWTIPSQDSARFFELFVIGMSRNGVGRLLETPKPPKDRRVTAEFRSEHITAVTLVVDGDRVSVEPPGQRPDLLMTFEPTALVLMLFGRIGKVRAMASGKVRVGGRRPWLLPEFMRTVRFPS